MINLNIKVETEFLFKGATHYSWPFCTLNCVNFINSWNKSFLNICIKKLLYLFNADCGVFFQIKLTDKRSRLVISVIWLQRQNSHSFGLNIYFIGLRQKVNQTLLFWFLHQMLCYIFFISMIYHFPQENLPHENKKEFLLVFDEVSLWMLYNNEIIIVLCWLNEKNVAYFY